MTDRRHLAVVVIIVALVAAAAGYMLGGGGDWCNRPAPTHPLERVDWYTACG